MNEEITPDPVSPTDVAEVDQLAARVRDLLASLGLEDVQTASPEPEWVAGISGEELYTALLLNAATMTSEGLAWLLVAEKTPTGGVAGMFVACRRRTEPGREAS